VQVYMGDEDGVDQVKTEDNGIVALCRCRWVESKRKAKASSLAEVGRASTSGVWWFCPQNHRRGLVVWASKLSGEWVYGFGPQNPSGGSEEERTACDSIKEFASRRSYLMKDAVAVG
jgi:hypothetical protein